MVRLRLQGRAVTPIFEVTRTLLRRNGRARHFAVHDARGFHAQSGAFRLDYHRYRRRFTDTSDSLVDTHLLIVVRGLPAKVRLSNASGTTHGGDPYIRVFLPDGVLQPGQQITQRFVFSNSGDRRSPSYAISLLSGQGTP